MNKLILATVAAVWAVLSANNPALSNGIDDELPPGYVELSVDIGATSCRTWEATGVPATTGWVSGFFSGIAYENSGPNPLDNIDILNAGEWIDEQCARSLDENVANVVKRLVSILEGHEPLLLKWGPPAWEAKPARKHNHIAYKGAGPRSCYSWRVLHSRLQQGALPVVQEDEQWVAGFLNGSHYEGNSAYTSDGLPFAIDWISRFCTAHPDTKIGDVAKLVASMLEADAPPSRI
jgi:hypothetical protein